MTDPLRTQKIRERAYAIWEGEGRPLGREREHWFNAEAEIAREEEAQSGASHAAEPIGRQALSTRASTRIAVRTAAAPSRIATAKPRSNSSAVPRARKKP